MRTRSRSHRLPGALLAGVLCALLAPRAAAAPRNLILFIGDGMGPEQVRAGGMHATGQHGTLFFEGFPYQAAVITVSADSRETDSAAAATAMATGVKVANGVVSLAIPGDGAALETILERCKAQGRSTGLVTTTYLTHATPAAFGAHQPSRDNLEEIGADYLQRSRPDVLLGGGGNGLSAFAAVDAGYTVVLSRRALLSLDTESERRVCGLFGTDHLPYEHDGVGIFPHLSEMTGFALAVLDNNPEGFFLLVEGGRIDHACHDNDIDRAVPEVVELARAVAVAVAWARGRDDTLILVTADHETGGLRVRRSRGAGRSPRVDWSTTGHTGVAVPLYAWGRGADRVRGVLDNTQIHGILAELVAERQVDAAPAARPDAGTARPASPAEAAGVPGEAALLPSD